MAFDATLAERVRSVMAGRDDVVEKRMFGGLAFMLGGHMCCGVSGSDLMVRVGPEAYETALAEPGARPMDFTGRPLTGFVFIDGAAVAADGALAEWIERGIAFAGSLEPKGRGAERPG